MYLWEPRLDIRSVDLRCCVNKLPAALVAFVWAASAPAQITTGTVEGLVRANDGKPLAGALVVIAGDLGFQTTVHTDAQGLFAIALPYGRYRISGVTVFVPPIQTTRVELVAGSRGSSATSTNPGLWSDTTRARVYPEPFNLQGVLLSREPSSVTEPLDFAGLTDNRLGLESQRATSWTATRYELQGIDAGDAYQPGRPMILANPEAVDEVVVRSTFADTTSGSYGTDVGLFLAGPGPAWHGELSSLNTGSPLAASNLPPPGLRGLVQQPDRFNWFTRDGLEAGGPVARWADVFSSASGQWSSQAVPLAAPGNDLRSRLLFANTRGDIRPGPRDRFDAEYVGSRADLSGWGVARAIEALAGNRMAPSFVLPGGFAGEGEVEHLDFLQTGWTHQFSEDSRLGVLEVRYGYSTAHLDAFQSDHATAQQQSRIELLDGSVTGAPPLQNFAIRTRHSIEAAWQPAALHSGSHHHQLVAGGGWEDSTPINRFNTPYILNVSGVDLITANGVPAFAVEFNTPVDSHEMIRSFSGYVADHITWTGALSVDVAGRADFSRGSASGQGTLISWNSLSPRASFTWRVPRSHDLVLRGAYHRLYAPLAGRYLDFGNPNGLSGSEYFWNDRNGDGFFQPGELGPLVMRFGGLYSSIAPSLERPYADEFDIAAEMRLTPRIFGSVYLFRRDDKHRLAAQDVGIPPQAFTPVTILDPGPDDLTGSFDNQILTVYQQNPATFGHDRYLLTNPPGLRMLDAGVVANLEGQWHGAILGASFVVEKSWGPTNPGDSPFADDPGVIGSLYLDPNTLTNATGHNFFDRAYVGKMRGTYRLPWGGIDVAAVADYMDGLVFARQLLVTGLAQGPFLVATTLRGSPEGGNRAEHVTNWNFRVSRGFRLRIGVLTGLVDVLNLTNAGHSIQQSDLSGPTFNQRLPVEIQAPRAVRLGFRLQF
jgi:hypothetical protein